MRKNQGKDPGAKGEKGLDLKAKKKEEALQKRENLGVPRKKEIDHHLLKAKALQEMLGEQEKDLEAPGERVLNPLVKIGGRIERKMADQIVKTRERDL